VQGRHACCLLALALLTGCDENAPPPEPSPPARPDVGRRFDPRTTGSIVGRVVWRGPRPEVPPFRSIEDPLTDQLPPPPVREWPNPNAPVIGPDGGVLTAVVFLRGVDPTRAKPWHHPPVSVDLAAHHFSVLQGDTRSTVGFVRAGDAVEFVSRQAVLHSVQARGAAFFSLTLPDPARPRLRTCATPGVVELASGAGFFWMRAYLLIEHHPYLSRTAEQGRFQLDDVPEGSYDLVAWHPSWRVVRQERNPDSFRVQQVRFAGPIEVTRRVRVEPGKTTRLDLDLPALLQ
jgi:hypothetical protein